ncbi:39S ribosomal protein L4, mitochondrial [Condylostylus longicornis]|uniref:39S ribosomal protein L4, mitochondrial n=1 Tax=Condylostylus longicornis TaxID=2530218 RepID=UPI00244E3D89|nr:39S ribosomal protein L4, mitochondrial [Condylostylus longicornis]
MSRISNYLYNFLNPSNKLNQKLVCKSNLFCFDSFQNRNYSTILRPRQAWVENCNTVEEKKVNLIELDPKVFAEKPRVDVIHENVEWQRKYRFVSFAHTKTRAEVRGGGRKPWPQKGLGRARHGSIRSPLFKGGGIAHGPRSPTTHFYMLPFTTRVLGLTAALSVKFAQDDLHFVENFQIPTRDPQFFKDLCSERNWGPSVLLVDFNEFPEDICYATDPMSYITLMPHYGLNVYSILKYETLVMTVAATKKIEEKLLFHMKRSDIKQLSKKFKVDQQ